MCVSAYLGEIWRGCLQAVPNTQWAAVMTDLIMKPEQTTLLELAAARGLRVLPGQHLLESSIEPITRFLRLVGNA